MAIVAGTGIGSPGTGSPGIGGAGGAEFRIESIDKAGTAGTAGATGSGVGGCTASFTDCAGIRPGISAGLEGTVAGVQAGALKSCSFDTMLLLARRVSSSLIRASSITVFASLVAFSSVSCCRFSPPAGRIS